MEVPPGKTQKTFFRNVENRKKFIELLSYKLLAANFTACQARDDTDASIVRKAIYESKESNNTSPVVIIGNDTDLLVIGLIPTSTEIFFFKKGKKPTEDRLNSSVTAAPIFVMVFYSYMHQQSVIQLRLRISKEFLPVFKLARMIDEPRTISKKFSNFS